MSYAVLKKAPHHRYLKEMDMFCVKEKEKIFIYLVFGDVIASQVILRNKIQRNNNLLKVTGT